MVDALRAADAVLSVEEGKDKAIVLKLRIARPAIVGVKELVAVVIPVGRNAKTDSEVDAAYKQRISINV